MLSRTFFPLQGFFNLLVYTYPHVSAYRRSRNVSWFNAFKSIIKKGGDNDEHNALRAPRRYRRSTRRSTTIVRNEPVVTEI